MITAFISRIMHAALQIIEAMATRLRGATLAEERVYTDRTTPFSAEGGSLPAWTLTHVDEPIEPATVHWPQLRDHAMNVAVVGHADVEGNVVVDLDTMRVQAEAAFFATLEAATLAPLRNVNLQLKRVTTNLVERQDTQPGTVTLMVLAMFHTFANAPEVLV